MIPKLVVTELPIMFVVLVMSVLFLQPVTTYEVLIITNVLPGLKRVISNHVLSIHKSVLMVFALILFVEDMD